MGRLPRQPCAAISSPWIRIEVGLADFVGDTQFVHGTSIGGAAAKCAARTLALQNLQLAPSVG